MDQQFHDRGNTPPPSYEMAVYHQGPSDPPQPLSVPQSAVGFDANGQVEAHFDVYQRDPDARPMSTDLIFDSPSDTMTQEQADDAGKLAWLGLGGRELIESVLLHNNNNNNNNNNHNNCLT